MKRILLLLALFSGFVVLRAAELAHIDDPGRLLPAEVAQAVEAKLAAFEHAAGIRVLVRYHAKSPSEEEDKEPGAYMQALAEKLGTRQRGVLAVYFADEPDWRVWIGDELTERFAGRTGTVQELTENKAIHDVKEAMFAEMKAQADARLASATDKSAAHRLALETEALVDGLKQRLAK